MTVGPVCHMEGCNNYIVEEWVVSVPEFQTLNITC
jgi:hypothetical protein